MTLKNFLIGGLLAIVAGFYVVGCNENPSDPDDPDTTEVAAATNVQAVSLNDTTVGIMWDASDDASSYTVWWSDGTDTTIVEGVTGTEHEASGLTKGTAYTFAVIAVDADDNESDAAFVVWAPASRYDSDSEAGGILRIYAKSVSEKGSGIVIRDDGAFNALTALGSSNVGEIQLIADVGSAQIRIGAPKSFTDFLSHGDFRNDVQISDEYSNLDPAVGLDGWYRSASLEGEFAGMNTGQYTIADQLTGDAGAAFAIRWGSGPGSYHYARAFIVPGPDGSLVQEDNNNDPFIEIQISYQSSAGVPYAKQ